MRYVLRFKHKEGRSDFTVIVPEAENPGVARAMAIRQVLAEGVSADDYVITGKVERG